MPRKNPHNTGPVKEDTPFLRAFAEHTRGMVGLNTGPACGGCVVCNSIWVHSGPAPEEQPSDEGGFSWSPCDTCGATPGGLRYTAHYFKGGPPGRGRRIGRHLEICADCLCFIANGDHPRFLRLDWTSTPRRGNPARWPFLSLRADAWPVAPLAVPETGPRGLRKGREIGLDPRGSGR